MEPRCSRRILCRVSVTAVPLRRRGAPPQVYFVGSAVFHYLGPAFAVLLFARVDVLGVAWLRIASAALVFAAVAPAVARAARLDADGRRRCSPGARCWR